jgi:trimethylamine:corrinoid methyltransferase-like protein
MDKIFRVDISKIKDGFYKILEKIGLEVIDENVIERLKKIGFKFNGKRVIIEGKKVDEFIEKCKKRNLEKRKEDNEIKIESGSHALYHFDPEKREIKPLTKDILEDYTKLVAGLYENNKLSSAFCPGQPFDIDPQFSQIYQQFLTLKYVKNPVIFSYSKKTFDIIYEMSKICNCKISTGVHPISPLKVGGEEFELALYLIDKNIYRDFGVAPMPVMGITASIDWVSAWAQSFAECIGTSILLENLGAENTYPYATLYVADMKTGNFVYGSPEHILITIFEKEINEKILGNPARTAKSLNTSSKTPDIFAGMEKSVHTFVALSSGYKKIGGAGILGVDEIFSPQQIFIDFEIVENVKRILKGIDEEYEDIEKNINEGIELNGFIIAETTIKKFRNFYFSPSLFSRETTRVFIKNKIDFLDKAWEMAKEVIRNYNYRIEEIKEKELLKILTYEQNEECI